MFFHGKSEIARKKIEGEIVDIYLDSNGNIAVEYSSSGYKKILSVLDKYCKNKFSVNISNGTIIDIKLLNNAKKLIILETDSTSLNIGTKISMIDIAISDELKEVITLSNKLVIDSKVANDKLILLCNNELISYSLSLGKLEKIHNLSTNQTNYITLADSYFTAIETNDKKYNYVTSKFDNTSISNVKISVLPKYIRSCGYLTYIVSENNLLIMNKWGVELKNIDFKFAPKNVIIINNSRTAALIYSSKIEFITL